jgi:putative transposase
METIDEPYTKASFYGVIRMTTWFRAQDYEVNVKRVRKLLRRLGLQDIYPSKKRSFFLLVISLALIYRRE